MTAAPEEAPWRKRGLIGANIVCAIYIVYLVFHPVAKEAVGWPSTSGTSVSTPSELIVETDPPAPTSAPGEVAKQPPSSVQPPPRKESPSLNIPFVTHTRT
ncbi:membrane-associated protein, putative, partial [Bodo saltans]